MNNYNRLNRSRFSELSHYQRTLLTFDKLYCQSDINNSGGIINIKSAINVEFLEKAINLCILMHPELRTIIIKSHGNIYQYIKEYMYEKIPYIDFSMIDNSYEEFNSWSKDILKEPFKLEGSNLYYFSIFKLKDDIYGVIFKINKIISDRYGLNIIRRDIKNLYTRIYLNKSIGNYSKTSFFDFKRKEDLYIKSMDFVRDKIYWNTKLPDISNKLNHSEYKISKEKRKSLNLNNELYYKLKDFLAKNRISVKTFFIMVIKLYTLFKINERYIVIGVIQNNRNKKCENFSVGVYCNIIFLKFDVDYNETLLNTLNNLEMHCKKDAIHSRYPYDILLNDFNIKKYGYNDFCLLEYDSYESDEECNWYFEEYINELTLVPLQIKVNVSLENVVINIDYMETLYEDKDIDKINEYLIKCSKSLLNGKRTLISDLLS